MVLYACAKPIVYKPDFFLPSWLHAGLIYIALEMRKYSIFNSICSSRFLEYSYLIKKFHYLNTP